MGTVRNLTLAFLLPVLLVLFLAVAIGYLSLGSLRAQHLQSSRLQTDDLQTIRFAAEFSHGMGELHQKVISALRGATEGTLSELELYFLHAEIVDALDAYGERAQRLAASELLVAVNHDSSKALLEGFREYRRFVIMATDIAAIDPSTAYRYVDEAREHFIRFTSYSHRISELLASRADSRGAQGSRDLDEHISRIAFLGACGLVFMMVLAWVSSLLVSRRLRIITEALVAISDKRNPATLPEIEKMAQRSAGEFGRVALGLLAFRETEAHRRKAENEAHYLSCYDSLTQLPNRRLIREHLNHALQHCAGTGNRGALIYFDLDHFKAINDTAGHACGDMLLIEVARRLQGLEGETPLLGRLGGDEFALVLPSLGRDPAVVTQRVRLLAEQIRQRLQEPFSIDGEIHRITSSIGITVFDGIDQGAEEVLKHTDAAMYQAKKAGRNTISFFDPQMQFALESRVRLEKDLRKALENDELFVLYQLQVDQNGQACGAEALLRWRHPQRGVVSPAEFIPLAEESGLIVPIGYWVLETAARQLQRWASSPETAGLSLAVNVSGRQFRDPDFVARIEEVLRTSDIRPELIKLELTESTVLKGVEETIQKMERIRALGVQFAMDDFGTGYSSLQYLKRLPLDQIKIDQSFVRDIPGDPNDVAIVRTIIAMGHALKLDVIAEGVETQEQLEFLMAQGCAAFQGYLFCRPLPAEELTLHEAARLNPSVGGLLVQAAGRR